MAIKIPDDFREIFRHCEDEEELRKEFLKSEHPENPNLPAIKEARHKLFTEVPDWMLDPPPGERIVPKPRPLPPRPARLRPYCISVPLAFAASFPDGTDYKDIRAAYLEPKQPQK